MNHLVAAWLGGLDSVLHPQELAFLTFGMAVGLIFGAIPGLGGTTALALLLPLTYGMHPLTALAMAGGVMGAVPMGGSISAILLNTPGSAPNAATCLDGYPLARQGKAGLAIGAAASANSVGGIIGMVSLLIVLPLARRLVLAFGPPELLLLSLLAFAMVATTARGNVLRSLIASGIGLLLAFVGYDDVTGAVRFTFGIQYLWDGIGLVPALIGLFAVAEMLRLWIAGGSIAGGAGSTSISTLSAGLLATFRHWRTVIRGSVIGTVAGAIPGVGGVVASFLAYSVTQQMSKDPASFGTGNIRGVIGPEAAINAKDCSTLIPTLALGIPGSAEMAVFLGILILHGLDPGPLMLLHHQREIYGLVWSLTASCILASMLGLVFVRPLAAVTRVPSRVLVAIVLPIALVGSWAVDQTIENVIVTTIFGMIGYAMVCANYPRLPIVLALVLGKGIERSFYQSMAMADGRWDFFVNRPVSLTLLTILIVVVAMPLRLLWTRRRLRSAAAVAGRLA